MAANSPSCYGKAIAHVPHTSFGEVFFSDGGNLPELAEQAATYSDSAQAFQQVTANLAHCTTFVYTSTRDGLSFKGSGSLGAMSFPSYGQESAAYAATLETQGIQLIQESVVVRQGDALLAIGLGNAGSVDQAQLHALVQVAVARARLAQAAA